MICQSFSSVVRLLAPGLFSLLMLSACTAQYTREFSQAALRDIGVASSVKITRTGTWALPEGTPLHLAPTLISTAEPNVYARLPTHLDRLLESIAAEWFHRGGSLANTTPAGSRDESGVMVQLSLAAVAEQLSSAREIADHGGITDESAGRDRLHLVMKIYDMRTGQLLDTMTGASVSGWRWQDQQVADLAEPTLRAMFSRLRGATTSIE